MFRLFVSALLMVPCVAHAQETAPASSIDAPRSYVTEHSGTFGGTSLTYEARVSETILRNDDGAPVASVFTTAYLAKGTGSDRPVLFLFNGGPGSPSLWLHMGAISPVRVELPEDPATPIPADSPLKSNPASLIDIADLVFIDPAGTGFSRILPAAQDGEFYTMTADAHEVADVIAQWTKANGREASPKYLLGESYGTIRAVAVVKDLQERDNPLAFDGVILLGQALNMVETNSRKQNIMAAVVSLPGQAAIALYHGRIAANGRTPEGIMQEAAEWAQGPYLAALVQGNRLPADEARGIAERLSGYTGVSAEYLLVHDLWLGKMATRTELLKDQGLVTGFYDARYTAPRAEKGFTPDASNAISPVYQARIEDYMRDALGVPLEEYRQRDPDVRGWDYNGEPSPFTDYPFGEWMAQAMRKEPKTRLMIGTGIYDLTTTVGAADYLLAQTDFPEDRVFSRSYRGGHMMYSDPRVLEALSRDLHAFVLGQPLDEGVQAD